MEEVEMQLEVEAEVDSKILGKNYLQECCSQGLGNMCIVLQEEVVAKVDSQGMEH